MNRNKITNITFTAIFIALVFVSTIVVRFPISLGWGYVHLGDAVVLLSGMLLGPVLGGLAAGLGSFLADFASGYAIYALPTLLIKGFAAFLVGIVYKNIKGEEIEVTSKVKRLIQHIFRAYIIVVVGYFLTDLLLANFILVDTAGDTAYAYASFGLIPNTIQIGFGIFISLLLYKLLKKPFNDIYNK